MSAIKYSLQKLDDVVAKLEGSVIVMEESIAGQQRDMFGGPSNQNAGDHSGRGGLSLDREKMAKKLDSAIAAVETLLADDEEE